MEMCTLYRDPIYAFFRRSGKNSDQAAELAQEFVLSLLEHERIGNPDPDRGRFRSYLGQALRNFDRDEAKKARALKRGGSKMISLSSADGEEVYSRLPADYDTPAALFDRCWGLQTLELTFGDLRSELASVGREKEYELFRAALQPGGELDYGCASASLGLKVNAAYQRFSRFKQRFADLLKRRVAATVASTEDTERELAFLMQAVARH